MATKTTTKQLVGHREETVVQAKKVFNALSKHPGASRADLIKFTGFEPGNVSRALHNLKAAKVVKVEGTRRGAKYWSKSNIKLS